MCGKKLNVLWAPGDEYIIHPGHPENPKRMEVFKEILLDFKLDLQYPLPLSRGEIEKVQFLGPEVNLHTAQQMAAGAVKMACEKILQNEKALVIARPPGHHSPRLSYGTRGFCTINNDALGIAHMLKKNPDLKLVIIDTDAHHGDGSEDFFYYEPRVKHFSIHQDGRTIFPGTGFPEVTGPFNNIRNIPLPPGSGDSHLFQAITELIIPEIKDFSPEYVIHVTGFDGHKDDYLSALNYSNQILGLVSSLLKPDLTIIEGGYDLRSAIPASFPHLLNSLLKKETFAYPSVTRKITRLMDGIKNQWEEGFERISAKMNSPVNRFVSFFYDEGFFAEEREETLFPCKNCRGLVHVKSRCFTKKEFLYLPRGICNNCKKQLKKWENQKEAETVIFRPDPF